VDVRFPNYSVPTDTTTYVSYAGILPYDMRRHIIRIEPLIDNQLMMHHIVVYLSGGTVPSLNKTIVENMPALPLKPLYAWAPGGDRFDLPDNVGFNVASDPAKDYTMVLSHHYNNPTHLTDQRDSSGIRLYLDTPRANNASFIFFGSIASINIPPGATLYREGGYFVIPGNAVIPPLNVFASFPHMHSHGKKIWLTRVRKNNFTDTQEYGKVLAWDYNSQAVYPETGQLKPGDTLYTQCLFENTGSTAITGGEATSEEMCLVGLSYWPDVGADSLTAGTGYIKARPNCDYPCPNCYYPCPDYIPV